MWHRGRYRRFAALALFVAAVLAGAFLVPKVAHHEPEEQKHRQLFDGWVRHHEGMHNWWDGMPADMGPWAVPFIVKRVHAQNWLWPKTYRAIWPKLPKALQGRMPPPHPFGEATRDAMEMFRLTCDNSEGTRLLVQELQDSDPDVRQAALRTLGGFWGRTFTTNDALKAFLPLLRDKERMVQLAAAEGLGSLGAAASNAVPLMIPLLSGNEALPNGGRVFLRANTALALAEIGPPASNAVPRLKNLMTSGDNYQNLAAAFALWRITSDVSDTLPVFIAEMSRFDRRAGFFPATALLEMGPRAKAAYSALAAEKGKGHDPRSEQIITEALRAIDPEAAAKDSSR